MDKLLAVVEVDKDLRVLCQAEGCGKSVYKRIHVVNDNNKIIVLGQTCYSRLYGECSSVSGGGSYYTGQESRKLTIEERNLLSENTQKLIDQFDHERRQLVTADINHCKEERVLLKTFYEGAQLKDVKCHFCKCSMKIHAKSAPIAGYKCDTCVKENRSMPLGEGGLRAVNITKNGMVKELAAEGGSADVDRERAEAYKNIRG